MPIEKPNNLSNPNESTPIVTGPTEKNRGIGEKLKGAANRIREHFRPISREGRESSSIKKAVQSLAGKIAIGASKAKDKAKGLFKHSRPDEADFDVTSASLKRTPSKRIRSEGHSLEEIAKGDHSDPKVRKAIETLAELLDTNNASAVRDEAKQILKDLVPAKSEDEMVERDNVAKRKNIATWIYVLYHNKNVVSLRKGIEDAFPDIFEQHPGISLVVDTTERKDAWLNMQ